MLNAHASPLVKAVSASGREHNEHNESIRRASQQNNYVLECNILGYFITALVRDRALSRYTAEYVSDIVHADNNNNATGH